MYISQDVMSLQAEKNTLRKEHPHQILWATEVCMKVSNKKCKIHNDDTNVKIFKRIDTYI